MTNYKTLEFWLVMLPLIGIAGVLIGGFDQVTDAAYISIPLAAIWAVLAVFWMARELYRRIAS